jgi:hypothetical protein
VKLTIRQLRRLIREAISNGWASPPQPLGAAKGMTNSREQIGSLAAKDVDTDDETGLSSHLVEPEVDPEDCFGPVPPRKEGDPFYAQQDPFVRDADVLPQPRR